MKIKDILKGEYINEKKLALEQVLNLSIPELILNKNKELTQKEQKTYQKIEKKIIKDIPVQYILKKSNFYNNDFYVNKHVLIPRPETEYLVEETNKLIENKFKDKKISILDIGTGSGIIAITLKMLNEKSEVTATDISKKALKVAKINQKKYKTDIKFIKTNLYKGTNKKYDVIISNPPYIEINSKKIEEKVKTNEPKIALFADDNGLFYYKEILKDITKIIKEDHIIAFEIGENQGNEIKKLIKEKLPNDKIIIKKDYNNYDRYIYAISQKKK